MSVAGKITNGFEFMIRFFSIFFFGFSFLLSGAALSLGQHFGIFGVGLNEVFLVFSLIFALVCVPFDGWKKLGVFFVVNRNVVYLQVSFVFFLFAGFVYGAVYEEDYRSLIHLFRILFFVFVVFVFPFIYITYFHGSVEKIFKLMVFGVLVSSVFNWTVFFGGDFSEMSLPGQNMIGQQVGLFLPFLFYWMISEKALLKRVILGVLVLAFVVTSLFSWSKASWVCVFFTFGMFLIGSGLRGGAIFLVLAGGGGLLLFNFWDLVVNVINTEFSASDGSGSNQQRIATILSGLFIARDYPFGVGAAYQYVAPIYVNESGMLWVQPDPHNTIAHIAASGGAGAVLSYLVLLFALFFGLSKSKLLNFNLKWALLGVFLNGIILMQFTGEFFTQAFWWMILGCFAYLSYAKFENSYR